MGYRKGICLVIKKSEKMKELLELIDKKIEEIENYSIDTQENEERYIHEINCLMQARYLLGGDGNCLVE